MDHTNSQDTMARTLYGEARNQDRHGMECVASVILNRAAQPAWWGRDVCGVCLHPYQFSCWNEGDPNRVKIESVDGSDSAFMTALAIAQKAILGQLTDQVSGGDYYKVKGTHAKWADGHTPVYTYRAHEFYKLGPYA